MRKALIVIFVIFFLSLGYLCLALLALYRVQYYYGYEGYCSETKIPNFSLIEFLEFITFYILIAYSIILELLKSFKKHLRFYKILFFFLLINLIFLACKIIEYPIILTEDVWPGYKQESLHMMYSPLIIFFSLHSLTLIWLNFRFQTKTELLKKQSKIFLLFVMFSFIVITIACLSVDYKICRG